MLCTMNTVYKSYKQFGIRSHVEPKIKKKSKANVHFSVCSSRTSHSLS